MRPHQAWKAANAGSNPLNPPHSYNAADVGSSLQFTATQVTLDLIFWGLYSMFQQDTSCRGGTPVGFWFRRRKLDSQRAAHNADIQDHTQARPCFNYELIDGMEGVLGIYEPLVTIVHTPVLLCGTSRAKIPGIGAVSLGLMQKNRAAATGRDDSNVETACNP